MDQERAELGKKLAIQVGNQLLADFYHDKPDLEIKDDLTLVTKADRAASLMISNAIQKQFPNDGILSEEETTIYPPQETVWVIDPLDGTTNFTQGLHHWGVSIACLIEGIPQFGVLYFPIVEELFFASKGEGAYMNDEPLLLKEHHQAKRYTFFVHCSRFHKLYQSSLPYKTRSLGSAAYHLCLVANGTAILAFETKVKIWDLAACWVIVRETGGVVQTYKNGSPFPAQAGLDYNDINYSVLAGTSSDIIHYARAHLTEKPKR